MSGLTSACARSHLGGQIFINAQKKYKSAHEKP